MNYFILLLGLRTSSPYAGDIESMPFIEALGQFSYRVGKIMHLNFTV